MMGSKTSDGPIVKLSSSSSTMCLEDSKCMLQIECSSSMTTLHQKDQDADADMKHRI